MHRNLSESWKNILSTEFDKPYFKELTYFVNKEYSNYQCFPKRDEIFAAFDCCSFKDLKFFHAAVLVGSIISRPSEDLMCLNLGHKSVASEMDFPRLKLLNIENFKQVSHSEEHLVLECNESKDYLVGTVCYAVPVHICPTVPKYKKVLTVINGEVTGEWEVAARDYNTK